MPELLTAESAADLFEFAPCGYITTKPDGTILRANRLFLDWTGFQPEDLFAGKRFQELIPRGARILYETHYEPLLRMQGEISEVAIDLVCSGGRRLPLLINASQVKDLANCPQFNRMILFAVAAPAL